VIGEPRLGKIITAAVHEDLIGEELTLTVTFARRDSKETWKEKSKALADGLKAFNISNTSSREDLSGSQTSLQSTQKKMKTKKSKKKSNVKENGKLSKLKEEDRLLIKEVGPKGQGREEEIERLLDEGGNPECESADGVPLVILATVNKHLDCITTLINAGANVNAKTPSKGNTALHEAVSLGGDGAKYVDALLGLGAKTNVKNDAGQTPYDLAMSSGHESIAQRFTSNVGDELLQKLTKPHKTKYMVE
jgi:ankyrin repeat protein